MILESGIISLTVFILLNRPITYVCLWKLTSMFPPLQLRLIGTLFGNNMCLLEFVPCYGEWPTVAFQLALVWSRKVYLLTILVFIATSWLNPTFTHSLCVPKSYELLGASRIGCIVRELLRDANDFTSLLFDFFNRLQSHIQATTSMILWSLWKSRNTKLWKCIDTPSSLIVQRAHNSLHEWQCLQRARQQMQCRLCPFQQQYHHRARHLLKYSLYTSSHSEAEALSLLEALTWQ